MNPKRLALVLFVFALCGVSIAGAAQTTGAAADATANQTIYQVALGNPNLSTLVTAVQAAGLVDTLSGPGPLTVFAPTNAAFDALPPGTLNGLLGNRTELTNVLTYHVVPGSYPSTRVITMPSLPTVQGSPLAVTAQAGGNVRVDGANVIIADIPASNGVIHVIDAVMIPPAGTPAPTLTAIPTATPVLTATATPTAAGFDALLVSICAIAGLALLIGVRRRS